MERSYFWDSLYFLQNNFDRKGTVKKKNFDVIEMIKFDKVGHIIKNFFSLIFRINNFYKTEIENLPEQNGNTFTS
jgi:hypothetical protein